MWLTFLCPGDVIYDVRSHNYILKFAEVEDIIMDILNPSKIQIENFDDFGAMVQFVKPLTIWCHLHVFLKNKANTSDLLIREVLGVLSLTW